MKNTLHTSGNRYTHRITAFAKLFLIGLLLPLVACNKNEPGANYTTMLPQQKQEDYSALQEYANSITMKNGKYIVDTTIIMKNINKKTLLADLTTEYLAEKKTIAEIPLFITTFLDGISENGNFDMVNPGEEWKVGIANFGHQVIKKVYNAEKKDSVLMVTYDRHPLPAKQLVYFSIGKNTALFSYNSGGLRISKYVAIIKFEGKKIVDFWYGNYDSEVTITKAELLKQIKLSGTRNGKC